MSASREVLEFLGTRYAKARAAGDELRLRALELVIAACAADAAAQPGSVGGSGAAPEPAPVPQPSPTARQAGPADVDEAVSWWKPPADTAG